MVVERLKFMKKLIDSVDYEHVIDAMELENDMILCGTSIEPGAPYKYIIYLLPVDIGSRLTERLVNAYQMISKTKDPLEFEVEQIERISEDDGLANVYEKYKNEMSFEVAENMTEAFNWLYNS